MRLLYWKRKVKSDYEILVLDWMWSWCSVMTVTVTVPKWHRRQTSHTVKGYLVQVNLWACLRGLTRDEKTHPNRKWYYCLGLVLQCRGKREDKLISRFLTVDLMYPLVSGSCYSDFPTMMVWDLELRAKTALPLVSSPVSCFWQGI